MGVALVVDVVDDIFMDEEPVVVLDDTVKDDGDEDDGLLLADVLESLEVGIMLVDDDSDDTESVSEDDAVLLADDPDSVLLIKLVGTLLEESDKVLVCEKLVLPNELDKEILRMELDMSDALDDVLLERLSVDAVDDKELVGEMDDEDMEALGVLLELKSPSDAVEELIDALDEVSEVVDETSKVVDEVSKVLDGSVEVPDKLLDELLERVDVSTSLVVLDELPEAVNDVIEADNVAEGLDAGAVLVELLYLVDDTKELSVLNEDETELDDLFVLVDDDVLEAMLLEIPLDMEEEEIMLDDIEELIEDELGMTGQDVSVVKTVVIVVVAVLVTVYDSKSAVTQHKLTQSLRFQDR